MDKYNIELSNWNNYEMQDFDIETLECLAKSEWEEVYVKNATLIK